ncbi:MAG: hypothetical protein P4N59_33475 [Negativicutes bacterium]|nr:hypothetical protein [Negativicutes bacterium]
MAKHKGILVSLLVVAAAIAADDPGGWTKAKWGMTEAQLAEAFGPDIVRLDPPDSIAGGKIKIFQAVDVQIGGTPFRAKLVPDKDGKLDSVLFSARDKKDVNQYTFQSLQELLVQKYGRPWKSAAGQDAEFQWSLGSTVITLSFTQYKDVDWSNLILQYRHKSPDPL